jgi:hypothetical protein
MPEAADPSRVYFGSDTHAMTSRRSGLATSGVLARCRPAHRPRRPHGDGVGVRGLAVLFAIFWFVGSTARCLYRGGFLVIGVITAGSSCAAVTASAFRLR